ncbi:AI-2E family transporter [Anaerococcus jeddahensis]|uniref:AI-2E family transporter n=1 Tax=Anaerococcus jeddahensis TaxID=1673719 RepID=UPI0006725406|nr:AI-2E family transporter [Anaerococcus jeddahensis]
MKKEFLKRYLKATGLALKDLIRALLLTSVINFVILAIGLGIFKIKYFILIAFLIALVDLLPFLGSGIILLPWSVILFLMGNLRLSIGLAILFVLTFLVNQILRPIFMGKSVGLKPIFTILITGISMLIFSPGLGALVGSIISLMLGVFFEVKEAFDIEKNKKVSNEQEN